MLEERALRVECLDILHRMKELSAIEAERLRAEDTADLDLANLSFDSLALLEFCMQLEERTGLAVEPADLLSSSSLNELVKDLVSRGDRRSA